MANKHNIIRTDFSYERMLELSPQEARKFFLLNFFVPVAYEILSNINVNGTNYVGLFVHKREGFFRPWFVLGYDHDGACRFNDEEAGYGLTDDTPIGDPTYIRYFEKIMDKRLDIKVQSAAMKHAFEESFNLPHGDCSYLTRCPLAATFFRYQQNETQVECGLNVVCKIATRMPHKSLVLSNKSTRIDVMKESKKYNSRVFNILTGEWVGLCDPAAPCASCAKIFASPAADNAYNDADIT